MSNDIYQQTPGYQTYSSLTYSRYSPMPMNPYTLLLQASFLFMQYLRTQAMWTTRQEDIALPLSFKALLSLVALQLIFSFNPKTKPGHPWLFYYLFCQLTIRHIITWRHRTDLNETHQCIDHGGSHRGLDNLLIKLTSAYWPCFSPVQEVSLLSYNGFLLHMPNLMTW